MSKLFWRKTLTWNWANAHIKFPRLLQSVHFLSLLADQRRVSALTQPLTFPPQDPVRWPKHGLNSSAWMFWLLFVVCNGSDSQLRFVMAPASTVYCFIHCACMLAIRWERDWKSVSNWNMLQWKYQILPWYFEIYHSSLLYISFIYIALQGTLKKFWITLS